MLYELLLRCIQMLTRGERAGLVRRVSPHWLRHSFATHMLTSEAVGQVVDFLQRFKRKTRQDSAGLVLDGELYYL